MTKQCIFSGMDSDTEEHVIPDWLQRRFGLQRATYQLPNSSALDYRHARVPAKRHLNQFFGEIEGRISQDKFVWEAVYLWLFKIHIGLTYRDTFLKSNITDPCSSAIVQEKPISGQLHLFRYMVNNYINNRTLGTITSPPGSVFVLPSLAQGYFDF
jgi:hypothetical protein